MEDQLKAALLLPPGEDHAPWHHTCDALAEAHGLRVVAIARTYDDLMWMIWCGDGTVDVGVVATRAQVREPLIVVEEAQQPPPPRLPAQRRPQWVMPR